MTPIDAETIELPEIVLLKEWARARVTESLLTATPEVAQGNAGSLLSTTMLLMQKKPEV